MKGLFERFVYYLYTDAIIAISTTPKRKKYGKIKQDKNKTNKAQMQHMALGL